MNYYKRHIGDYLRDTTHLTMLEHGAYNRLLDLYYLREGPLPSLAECQRLVGARTDEEKSAVAAVLKDFFAETDEGFKQTRCEKELAAYRAKADKNRLAGQKGGQSKRTPSERLANAQQAPSESNPNHKPLTTNQEKEEKTAQAPDVDVWSFGLDLLAREAGMSHGLARSYLGGLCKSWPETTVLDALMAAAGKADPKAYARKWLESKPRKGERRKTAAEELMEELGEG